MGRMLSKVLEAMKQLEQSFLISLVYLTQA